MTGVRSILEKVTGAAKAYAGPKATDALAQKRYGICRGCLHRRLSPIEHCHQCSCPLPLKTTRLHASCPLHYW